jgi:plastocyanin
MRSVRLRIARVTVAGFAVACGLLSASIGPYAAAHGVTPKQHTVVIEATSFAPASLSVAVGDEVVWVNKDFFPHTATSKQGGFDSKRIEPDRSWTFTAKTKGEFPYLCTLHPTMKGVLRVK